MTCPECHSNDVIVLGDLTYFDVLLCRTCRHIFASDETPTTSLPVLHTPQC